VLSQGSAASVSRGHRDGPAARELCWTRASRRPLPYWAPL